VQFQNNAQGVCNEGPQHKKVTLYESHQPRGAVYQAETQGQQGINNSQPQSAYQDLYEHCGVPHLMEIQEDTAIARSTI
jgi:hypothetical protein